LECILNQVDTQFDAAKFMHYRLSILLCRDGFSYLITDTDSQRILNLSEWKFTLGEVPGNGVSGWAVNGIEYFEQLKKVELVQNQFMHTDIAIASHKITVVPHDFSEHGSLLNIISAVHSVDAGEEIISGPVFDTGPVIAIAVPGYIGESCNAIFPGATVHPAAAVFVKGVIRSSAHLITRQIFLNGYPDYFEITVIQGSRLLYLNAFRYSAPSDVLYYVIFVLEQLGFVPSEENVTIMGEFSDKDIIFTQLKMYLASLSFSEKPEGIECGDGIDASSLQRYFTLLNMPLCG